MGYKVGEFKTAKKNIKAVIVMTKDEKGNLIPAENSVRFHWNLDGPPYFDKKYNAVYIEDKIKLYHNYFGKLERISIDSIKDGHCAEYKANLCEYTLFGPNAGKTRKINKAVEDAKKALTSFKKTINRISKQTGLKIRIQKKKLE